MPHRLIQNLLWLLSTSRQYPGCRFDGLANLFPSPAQWGAVFGNLHRHCSQPREWRRRIYPVPAEKAPSGVFMSANSELEGSLLPPKVQQYLVDPSAAFFIQAGCGTKQTAPIGGRQLFLRLKPKHPKIASSVFTDISVPLPLLVCSSFHKFTPVFRRFPEATRIRSPLSKPTTGRRALRYRARNAP